jgi:hypothetical protein
MQGEANGRSPSGAVFGLLPQKKIRLIDSEALGERIVLVDGEGDVGDASFLYPDQVVYTHAEVSKILGVTDETLRGIHGIKKALHGRISFVALPAEPAPAAGLPPAASPAE